MPVEATPVPARGSRQGTDHPQTDRPSRQPTLPFGLPVAAGPHADAAAGSRQLPPPRARPPSTKPNRSTWKARSSASAKNRGILEQTLTSFNIEGKVEAIDTGPVVTLYELSLAPGIKSSQVATPLKRHRPAALMSPPIRIIDNIPGKSTMGVEVPNIDRERVRLKELLSARRRHDGENAAPHVPRQRRLG